MNTKTCPVCETRIPGNAPGGLCPACVLREAEEPPPIGRAAPSITEIGAAFPRLEVLRLIGQGGMGFVYQARQPSLDRTVALKILAPELGRDPAFAERFAREARVLGKLSHPNIVTVFEHGQSGGYFYLLMEYVEGVNLRQAMRAGRFTPPQALAVVPGICDALQAAHAQGVWHRDIKPENILLDARGGVKIADFGIARIVGDPARDFTLTATGGALGSAAYMAPEQHEKPHDVDHRADIYSLGVVIYEMLTGELPLGRFPAPSQRAAVSARIDEIVFQTLEKERELRQQSASEVKTDVQGAATSIEARLADAAGNRRSHPTPSVFAKLALGGLLAAILTPAFCLAFFRLNGGGLTLSVLLFLFAGIFGWLSRDERMGKTCLVAAGVTPLVAIGITAAILLGDEWLARKTARPPRESLLPTAPEGTAGGRTVEVRYATPGGAPSGIHTLTLTSRTPYGWVTDFSLRLLDSTGERELPAYSALVAQQSPLLQPEPSPKTKPTRPATLAATAEWSFTPGSAGSDFHIAQHFRKAVLENESGNLSGAGVLNREQFARYRWEAHPGQVQSPLHPIYTYGVKIPFLRGIPMEAGSVGEAELFVIVKSRPMKPGERTRKFEVFGQEDRYERLANPAFTGVAIGTPTSSTPAGMESWSYTLRHLSSEKVAQWSQSPKAVAAGWDSSVSLRQEAGIATLTGPRERIRRLATVLRAVDQPEVENPLELPLLNMPPEFFTRMTLPSLMFANEFTNSLLSDSLIEDLKRAGVTAPQLARALSAHVLELDKAMFTNTGTPFESIVKSPGASAYYEGVIPCADQPDKPLTLRVRRTTQTVGTKPDITGFAPWLIEEAKLQSKEPLPVQKNAEGK